VKLNVFKLRSVALASLLLGGCANLPPAFVPAWTAERFTGQVVEQDTGRPMPGAIVVGLWMESRSDYVHSRFICVRVESATTDANGSYRFPKWRNQYPQVFVYRPGFKFAERYYSPERPRTVLQPFSGTTKERLDELRRLTGRTWCDSAAETGTKENLLSLWQAMYDEAKNIAQIPRDQEEVDFFLTRVEELTLGWETAEKRQLERGKIRRGQ